MSSYKKHAFREFTIAGWCDCEGKFLNEEQQAICEHVLQLLEVFEKEGHSGSSASYAVKLFADLAMFKLICPLTGEDEEWVEITSNNQETLYQNIRISSVFKSVADNGRSHTYDIDSVIHWEWYKCADGKMIKNHFVRGVSCDQREKITFPYTPSVRYVFSPTKEFPNEEL